MEMGVWPETLERWHHEGLPPWVTDIRLWPGCALMGGMDKRVIASGRQGVETEIERIRPVLAEGTYIPFLDHFVPPDVSYETYLYYVERRREVLGGPPGREP